MASTHKGAQNRYNRNQRSAFGGVTLEAALSTGFLLFLIFTGIDLLQIAYVSYAGEHALQRTARWALLNNTIGTLSRPDAIKEVLGQNARSYGIDVDPNKITVCPVTNTNCNPDDAGAPGQFFRITLKQPVSIRTFGYSTDLDFQVIGENEPSGAP